MRSQRIAIPYLAIVVLLSLVTVLVLLGKLPTFFDPHNGPSLLRQYVLGTALALFALSGLVFVEIHFTAKTEYAFWHGLALLLIAIGLACVLLQTTVGGLIGWVGRGAQYLGGCYFLLALLRERREFAEFSTTSLSSAAGTLWPYLEQKIQERTVALTEGYNSLHRGSAIRKQAELELKEALAEAQRFREALDQLPTYVYMKDTQSRYMYANRSTLELFNCPAEQLVGSEDSRFFSLETVKRLRAIDLRVFAGERTAEEIATTNPKGEQRYYWETKTPIHSDPERKTVCGLLGVSADITELKRAETELADSRAELLAIINSTDDMIWSVDSQRFALLGFNLTFKKYMLEERGIEAAIGMTPENLLPTDHVAIWNEFYSCALREGSFITEYTVVAGSNVLLLSINVVKRGNEVLGLSVFGKDITKLKQTEADLRESEERFSAGIQAMREGFVLQYRDGKVVICNQSAERILGLTAAQIMDGPVLGPSWSAVHEDGSFFPVETRPSNVSLREGIVQNDVVMGIEKPSGERTWVSVNSIPIGPEKNPGAVVVTFADITERKQVEAMLHLKSAALESTINTVVITDPQGTIEWVNPAFTKITGYSGAEAIGQNPRILKSGQQPDSYYADMWRAIRSGRSWQGEFVNKRKDGSLYTEEVTVTPVRDQTGAIAHYVAVKQDISDKKMLEKQLFEIQRLESIGLLASGIAHDLNNVLMPISLSIELLKDQYPEEQERLDLIEQSCRRGADIIRQVLTFARGMDGKRIGLRVGRLIKDMVRLTSETFPRNIDVTCDVDIEEDYVRVDPTQIHQVLLNLAVNARDAMPNGGLLSFQLRRENISDAAVQNIKGASPGEYVVIVVRDTGSGIPPEMLPRIFDPFFTNKPRGQGTGLGLSTVHGIVHSHGGFIQVQSQLEVGTEFRVYLPAIPSPEADAAKAAKSTSPLDEGHGELILVADDEATIREITRLVLERRGYSVLLAQSGNQALDVFRANQGRVKAAILDRMMPGLSGENIAQLIHLLAPRLPIFLSTGLVTEGKLDKLPDNEEELKRAGIIAVLRKPYNEADLLKMLRDCLRA